MRTTILRKRACSVRSAPEPIDEKKDTTVTTQNLLKTPTRSDYFNLELIAQGRSFNYFKKKAYINI